MRDLDVIELELDRGYAEGNIGAHYLLDEEDNVSGVAIDPDAPIRIKEAYLAEATAYHCRRPPKTRRRTMLHTADHGKLDPNSLLAMRCIIEEIQPAWVVEVRDACRWANTPRLIADYCDLSVSAVVAIVENLKARGEIPDEAAPPA